MSIPRVLHDQLAGKLTRLAGGGQKILDGMKKTSKPIETWSGLRSGRMQYEEVEELDEAAAIQWLARAAQLLQSIVPESSPHRALVDDLSSLRQIVPHLFKSRFQRFLAVKSDFDDGLLDDSWLMIRAEVAADYLLQAQLLLDQGLHVPAAVLAGAVLEDALRRMCRARGIPTEKGSSERKTINPMNDDLVKAGAYAPAKADEIRAWAKHRNDAAHGDGERVPPDDVRRMVEGVQAFVADNLR